MNKQRKMVGALVTAVAIAALPAGVRAFTDPFSGAGGTACRTCGPTTTRVSVSTSGAEPNDIANSGTTSADGRFVAFASPATNLVAGDTNGVADVFLRDRTNRTTERISVSSAEAQGAASSFAPDIASGGGFVAFASWANLTASRSGPAGSQIYVRDLANGTTSQVSVSKSSLGEWANGSSFNPVVSADGRYVAFESQATNLVNGDTNGRIDIFRRDRATGATVRVSVTTTGMQGTGFPEFPSISDDGRFVAFATNGALDPADMNGDLDVYLWSADTGKTVPVSVDASARFREGESFGAAISGDGQKVAFSGGPALQPSDTNGMLDVYVRTPATGALTIASLGAGNVQSNGHSFEPSLNTNGDAVAFISEATNLVSGDTNAKRDAFVRRVSSGITSRISVSSTGAQGDAGVFETDISGNGAVTLFRSTSTNVVTPDNVFAPEIYARA